MDDLYKEIIIDRYQNPQNKGVIEDGVEAFEANMLCGDKLKITARVKNGVVEDIKFDGGGCAISMASVDMLLDKIKGKKIEDIKRIKGDEIEEMLGVELTPARKKCAYLGLEVVRKIVNLNGTNCQTS